jgi:hypothetical protein
MGLDSGELSHKTQVYSKVPDEPITRSRPKNLKDVFCHNPILDPSKFNFFFIKNAKWNRRR